MRTRPELLKLLETSRPWVGKGDIKPITVLRDWFPTEDQESRALEALVDGEMSVNEYRSLWCLDPL